MPDLFNPSDLDAIARRINQLHPGSRRQWGKMNVAQMLAHCNRSLETALGMNTIRRLFIGRLLGPLVKKQVLSDKPFGRNSPTDSSYKFTGEHSFEEEKSRLLSTLYRFHQSGEAGITTEPHPFFGKFTPREWALFQWKHLDHHLRQFGG